MLPVMGNEAGQMQGKTMRLPRWDVKALDLLIRRITHGMIADTPCRQDKGLRLYRLINYIDVLGLQI